MAYEPIQNYGLIGNMRTAALVSRGGAIDWMCYPHFDSPSLFGAILDDAKGGRFSLSPCCATATGKQFYWPDTNVLITRFLSEQGVAEVEDFMPVGGRGVPGELVRRVRCVRGSVPFRMICQPAFDYGRAAHQIHRIRGGVRFESAELAIDLLSGIPLEVQGSAVHAQFCLPENQHVSFVVARKGACEPPGDTQVQDWFEGTIAYWREWVARSQYAGRWREIVNRSALVLKLLTFEPTGAIIAAPTTSLPEAIGGPRNWDYRYTWIRDASFILYSFMRLGFTGEATAFMSWIEKRYRDPGPGQPLAVLYGIDGRQDLGETTLDHWEGYRKSWPVRVGNAAHNQLQLDIYGELFDSVYLYNKYGQPISYDSWTRLRQILNWVAENWQRPDDGIWEIRGGKRQFVYSKALCWVALDRGLRLADKRSFPGERGRWLEQRDRIYEQVMREGWDAKRETFLQAYGEPSLDASLLILPLVFFASPSDPRMLKTIEALMRPRDQGGLYSDGLVYRYAPAGPQQLASDGLTGTEGTFNICSFWLVEALTRAGRTDRRYLDAALLLFERMLGYANHLGLYAEQTGFTGEALGNFPQGLTHLGLISAAFNLNRALG
jgi:GH15 family glucan-1,4-alpha-glucosidase